MAKHAVAKSNLCILLFGLLVGNAEVFGYAKQVTLSNLYPIIAAAIRGAFRAVEKHPQRATVFLRLVVVNYSCHCPTFGLIEANQHSITQASLGSKESMSQPEGGPCAGEGRL